MDARIKLGQNDALELAHQASIVVVTKGKKVTTIDMKKNPPNDQTLISYMLGPTGNLRAPAIRSGKTVLIGFNEDVYAENLV